VSRVEIEKEKLHFVLIVNLIIIK